MSRNFSNTRILSIVRRGLTFGVILLLVEFFDELHYGLQSAALPAIRNDLGLSYAEVGLLLGLPKIVSTIIEPFLFLLGDTSLRKRLVVGGGLAILAALLLTVGANSFLALLAAFVISFPASGAFVSLSQASLMDINPGRQAKAMARWTVYGSAGNLLGPLLLTAGFAVGLGWRWSYLALAALALGLVLSLWRLPFPSRPLPEGNPDGDGQPGSIRQLPAWMWNNLRQVLKVKALLRWVSMLEISDLMLDVLTSYAALYFADVVGLNSAQTGLVITLLMGASLASDLVLIPLLEKVDGRVIVRVSALVCIPLFLGFLLVPWALVKVILILGVRLSTIGWYPVMKGETYAAAPERSGTVEAINSLAGVIGGVLTWVVGAAANQFGLQNAFWLLLSAPLALVLFVPKPAK